MFGNIGFVWFLPERISRLPIDNYFCDIFYIAEVKYVL